MSTHVVAHLGKRCADCGKPVADLYNKEGELTPCVPVPLDPVTGAPKEPSP
jgi:hypothetical protein